MDPLPLETDSYIKASIDHLVGLPVPEGPLRLKLLASEDARRRLQDQVFLLQERLRDAERRAEQCKAEAMMSAQGLRRCIEEKEVLGASCGDLTGQCERLERECALYDKDIERLMEHCDELGRENEELKAARAKEVSDMMTLLAEHESLQKDKENLRINLHRAEEEVKLLFEENKMLDKENKLLHKQLKKEKHHGSDVKQSANSSINGKRKSCTKESEPTEKKLDFSEEDSRQPLSPLHPNSPDSRRHKKQWGG